MSKKITLYLFPASVLVAAYLYLPHVGAMPGAWRELLPTAVYLLFMSGILLSLHFNKSRMFFVLLILTLFYWYGFGGGGCRGSSRICTAVDFLFPANIALISIMREKGLFTPVGRKRCAFFAIQLILLVLLGKGASADATVRVLPHPGAALPIREAESLTLIFMGLCGIPAAILSRVRQSLIDSSFLGVLAAMTLVLAIPLGGDPAAVMFLAAGMILVLSVLQESHDMAFRDDLTGLLSRRALNERMAGMGRRFVVAMLDLDHFKRLNDSLGHDVGDQVLKMVAARIRQVGGGGKAYRYGGEEFTVLFPGRSLEEVLPFLEELRASIAGYQFHVRSHDRPEAGKDGRKRRSGSTGSTHVGVTVSIGVAESSPHLKDPQGVMAAADAALYRAKQRGRNRVSTASGT